MERLYKLFYVTMLALFVSTSVFAYDCEVDGIYYNRLSADELEVTFGVDNQGNKVKYSGNIVIPETVTYREKLFKVTKIGYMAFSECSALTSISIPQSITTLPDNCFVLWNLIEYEFDCNVTERFRIVFSNSYFRKRKLVSVKIVINLRPHNHKSLVPIVTQIQRL